MKRFLFLPILLVSVTVSSAKAHDTHLPRAKEYRTSDPAVIAVLQDIRRKNGTNELNSVMILKDGKKILEYYDAGYGPEFLNICWSASKTFAATAIGFAVQEGLLSTNDPVIKHLRPEQLPPNVSDTLAALTIHDALRMASGLKEDKLGHIASYCPDVNIKTLLSSGFIFYPGQRFKYNSFNTYLLSAIITNITGETVSDYLKPRLFKPLGIKNYHWDKSLEGYSMGGWGLYVTSESLAKMGQLFLQKGMWNGKQIIDPAWVEKATSAQIMQYQGKGLTQKEIDLLPQNDKYDGYCYQMWRGRHNSVRLDGAHGQYSIILPDQNAVIVLTGNSKDTKALRDSIWKHLLPLVENR